MPVFQGFVRLRKHQFGRQAVLGTKVAATRAYPFSGVPDHDLTWTDPEVDAGSRDPVAPPYRGAADLTGPLEFPTLYYNNLPLILSAFFGGQIDPTGGGDAKTWTYEPASETVDDLDPFTYEFGDDVLTDWFQYGDGILESFEITGPEGLGALSATTSWRFGSIASTGSTDSPVTGTVPTPGLAVSINDAVVYLKDASIFIASDPADLATSKIEFALHTFVLRADQEIDQKRTADGTQNFNVTGYGPGARNIEFEATFAKTADTVGLGSESDAWMSDIAVNRYVRMTFTSTVLAQTPATFHSWTFTMPMRYYTREEGEIGGNTTVVLTGHAFFDPDDFDGVFDTIVVNTLTDTLLGEGSLT
jgi:hypothetical protein